MKSSHQPPHAKRERAEPRAVAPITFLHLESLETRQVLSLWGAAGLLSGVTSVTGGLTTSIDTLADELASPLGSTTVGGALDPVATPAPLSIVSAVETLGSAVTSTPLNLPPLETVLAPVAESLTVVESLTVTEPLTSSISAGNEVLAPLTQVVAAVTTPITTTLAPVVELLEPAMATIDALPLDQLTSTVSTVLNPVLSTTSTLLAPIVSTLDPILDAASPVLESVLAPTLGIVNNLVESPLVSSVLELTAPILDPLMDSPLALDVALDLGGLLGVEVGLLSGGELLSVGLDVGLVESGSLLDLDLGVALEPGSLLTAELAVLSDAPLLTIGEGLEVNVELGAVTGGLLGGDTSGSQGGLAGTVGNGLGNVFGSGPDWGPLSNVPQGAVEMIDGVALSVGRVDTAFFASVDTTTSADEFSLGNSIGTLSPVEEAGLAAAGAAQAAGDVAAEEEVFAILGDVVGVSEEASDASGAAALAEAAAAEEAAASSPAQVVVPASLYDLAMAQAAGIGADMLVEGMWANLGAVEQAIDQVLAQLGQLEDDIAGWIAAHPGLTWLAVAGIASVVAAEVARRQSKRRSQDLEGLLATHPAWSTTIVGIQPV